jgi:hypothetical protein
VRGGWTRDDAGLERALAEAVLAARAVPPQFRVAARAAYDWRTRDAELAALARDRATVPGTRRTGREDVPALRDLTFVAGDLTMEIELGGERLLGQVVPRGPGRVQLQTMDGDRASAEIDALGCFVLRPAPRGCFRLHLRTAAGARVVTAWVGPGPEGAWG